MPDYTRLTRALSKVTSRVKQSAKVRVPRNLALYFVPFVIQNIVAQKFMFTWNVDARSYHPIYSEWKKKYFSSRSFWRLSGALIGSITYFSVKNGYMAGIPAGVMDAGGTSWYGAGDRGPPKPIAMYGRLLEFGGYSSDGRYYPPRPVFGPSLIHYRLGRGKEVAGKILHTYVARGWS